ncbi:MAG: type III-A CRISPR-associated RAMP protein Csm5 [Candidatus Methanofastidiosa archaeon]|nr:type III-A CRISPR-associated RAMP protein Csm5 [Candidatus Methanofastidiosa archaeon]
MKLQALSPIHVGTNKEFDVLEYLSVKGLLVVADDERLVETMAHVGALEMFNADLIATMRSKTTTLLSILKTHGLWNSKGIASIEAYRVKKDYALDNEKKYSIRQFMRTPDYLPYIPGSSIKGAIRTAVLYGILKKAKEENEQKFDYTFVSKFEEALRITPKRKMNRAASEFERILQTYPLTRDSRPSPNTDIMRAVRISDTAPLDKDALELRKVHIFNKGKDAHELQKMGIHLECIPAGSTLEFDCTINKTILADFEAVGTGSLPFRKESDLVKACETFSRDLWEFESSYFESERECTRIYDFYRSGKGTIRLGAGSGLAATTIFMLMPESKRHLYRQAYDRYTEGMPTSRKVVIENDAPSTVLGWGTLS